MPVSHEVTVAVGADEVDVDELVVEVVEGMVDELVLVVECLVVVGVVDVDVDVVDGGGFDVVVGFSFVVVVDVDVGPGSAAPKFQLPYATPWPSPPGTMYLKSPGEKSIAPKGHSMHCMHGSLV